MFKWKVLTKINPIYVMLRDKIILKYNDEEILEGGISSEMTINKVGVFEATDWKKFKKAIGGVFGEV